MTNLQQRTLSSVAFVLLVLVPPLISPWLTFLLFVLFGFFTLRELAIMLRFDSVNTALALGLFVWHTALIVAVLLTTISAFSAIIAGLAASALPLVAAIFTRSANPFATAASSAAAPAFVATGFLSVGYFLFGTCQSNAFWTVAAVLVPIWANDSGAYLVGRQFGKRKLFERVSPNKTWEGSLGGMAIAITSGALLSYTPAYSGIIFGMGFGALMALGATAGDLFESRLKRDAGVKDSGQFLPGHGGFFDRFDAMIFALPLAVLYFEFFHL